MLIHLFCGEGGEKKFLRKQIIYPLAFTFMMEKESFT